MNISKEKVLYSADENTDTLNEQVETHPPDFSNSAKLIKTNFFFQNTLRSRRRNTDEGSCKLDVIIPFFL